VVRLVGFGLRGAMPARNAGGPLQMPGGFVAVDE
jgi:hypothetical protein